MFVTAYFSLRERSAFIAVGGGGERGSEDFPLGGEEGFGGFWFETSLRYLIPPQATVVFSCTP